MSDQTPETCPKFLHATNCGAYPGSDEPCTCGLEWRIKLRTEQEMHAAWRKRAEEAEAQLAAATAEVEKLREHVELVCRERRRRGGEGAPASAAETAGTAAGEATSAGGDRAA